MTGSPKTHQEGPGSGIGSDAFAASFFTGRRLAAKNTSFIYKSAVWDTLNVLTCFGMFGPNVCFLSTDDLAGAPCADALPFAAAKDWEPRFGIYPMDNPCSRSGLSMRHYSRMVFKESLPIL